MNCEHVIGIEMPSICFAATLGKEHHCIAERARMRPVQARREQVDLRLQDVDAFEQAGSSVFQVLLKDDSIDEFDPTALHDLEAARGAQVDQLTAVDDLHEVQIEEGIVEVLAKILEPEDRLVLDELRLVK
jgi:hypothetical protein